MNNGKWILICTTAMLSLIIMVSCKKTSVEPRSAAALASDFAKCVEKNDVKGVRQCVKEGLNVNQPVAPWGLPLHYAIQWRSEGIVNVLLEAGADPTLSIPADTSKQTGVVQRSIPTPVVLGGLLLAASEMCGDDPGLRRLRYEENFKNYTGPQIDILSDPSTTEVYRRILASLKTAELKFKTNEGK
jgi:hypothetical protein